VNPSAWKIKFVKETGRWQLEVLIGTSQQPVIVTLGLLRVLEKEREVYKIKIVEK
jgi:hypothetical protein